MKIKRAIGFGVMLWLAAFVVISILYQIVWLVLEIPVVLLLAKWYFKLDPPTIKKGLLLGLIGLLTSTILDLIITIPLFVSPQSYRPLSEFFLDWKILVSFGLVLLLTTYAGYEFDATYTKKDESENKNELL